MKYIKKDGTINDINYLLKIYNKIQVEEPEEIPVNHEEPIITQETFSYTQTSPTTATMSSYSGIGNLNYLSNNICFDLLGNIYIVANTGTTQLKIYKSSDLGQNFSELYTINTSGTTLCDVGCYNNKLYIPHVVYSTTYELNMGIYDLDTDTYSTSGLDTGTNVNITLPLCYATDIAGVFVIATKKDTTANTYGVVMYHFNGTIWNEIYISNVYTSSTSITFSYDIKFYNNTLHIAHIESSSTVPIYKIFYNTYINEVLGTPEIAYSYSDVLSYVKIDVDINESPHINFQRPAVGYFWKVERTLGYWGSRTTVLNTPTLKYLHDYLIDKDTGNEYTLFESFSSPNYTLEQFCNNGTGTQVIDNFTNVVRGTYLRLQKNHALNSGLKNASNIILSKNRIGQYKLFGQATYYGYYFEITYPEVPEVIEDRTSVNYKFFSYEPEQMYQTKGLMELPSEISNRIDPLKSTIDISQTSIQVLNENQDISTWLYSKLNSITDNIIGAKAQIILLIDTVEVVLYTGIIESISNDPFETYFVFRIKDIQDKLKRTLFSSYFTEGFNYKDSFIPSFTGWGRGYNLLDETLTYINFRGHSINFIKGIFVYILGDDYLDYLDVNFYDITDSYFTDEELYFEFTEKLENPIDFIQKNVLRAINVFPYINNEGKFSGVKYTQPNEGDITDIESITIDENCIINVLSVENSFKYLVNNIVINSNFDYNNGKEFKRTDYYLSSESYDKFESVPFKPLEFNLKGVSSDYFTDIQAYLDSFKNNIFDRFDNYIKIIKLKVFFSKRVFNIGDIVMLTHNNIIDWDLGKAGQRGLLNDLSSECIIDISQWGNFNLRISNLVNSYKVIDLINYSYMKGTILIDTFNNSSNDQAQSILKNHNKIFSFIPPKYF